MRIILVRHGQPDWSPGGLVSNDPHLTDLGHAQVERLADRRWGHVDHIWVSPYNRSQETAMPVAKRLGLVIETLDWMAEIGPAPDWEGSPVEELEQILSSFNHGAIDDLWEGMPGGESFRHFHVRVTRGLQAALERLGVSQLGDGLWSEPPDVTVMLVAHGGTNAVAVGHLLDVDPTPWEWDRFDSAHTSVATLTTRRIAHGSAFGMVGFGDVTHLDADMVTR
ncbi:MAG: histidine phosphatase family protein [Acidimicrobiia bacterium]|nr:histidine phosphatase family protein [Acidimicrobiia bacterium]MDH4306553.1 histidine phosphatase family protein [Acidimicrobiia bacterium]MDH5293079.1 histidine phosphatase family protein [Acidimicrobiia bacterium]